MNNPKSGNLRRLLFLSVVIFSLACPLPTGAHITFSTRQYSDPGENPVPTQANMDQLAQAIQSLADDPRLAKHPIRRYLDDPDLSVHIIFDNPYLISHGLYASVRGNQLRILSNKSFDHYLTILVHEFIHIDIAEKYLQSMDYSFLYPEDWAFQNLMEESFGVALALWVHLTYPEIPNDPHVRGWAQHFTVRVTAEAMYNDIKASYPELTAEQIGSMVAAEMFYMLLTRGSTFSLRLAPNSMAERYGDGNTFLIPEYAAYRERGNALLRCQWNYMASMMPFPLPEKYTYDFFRNRFRNDYTQWAIQASSPETSILYWINFPAEKIARARIASNTPKDASYSYLPPEDEARLNRIFLDIDPFFTPVDTSPARQRYTPF